MTVEKQAIKINNSWLKVVKFLLHDMRVLNKNSEIPCIALIRASQDNSYNFISDILAMFTDNDEIIKTQNSL